jgi:hypothetical protein
LSLTSFDLLASIFFVTLISPQVIGRGVVLSPSLSQRLGQTVVIHSLSHARLYILGSLSFFLSFFLSSALTLLTSPLSLSLLFIILPHGNSGETVIQQSHRLQYVLLSLPIIFICFWCSHTRFFLLFCIIFNGVTIEQGTFSSGGG